MRILASLCLLLLPSCANSIAGYTDGQGGKYFAQVGSALTRSKASRGQASSVTITKANGDRIELKAKAKGESDETRVPVMAGYMSAGEAVLNKAPAIVNAVKP